MRPETCRDRARECRAQAAEAASSAHRALLLWHALVWDGLAGGDFRPGRPLAAHPEALTGAGTIATEPTGCADPAR